MISNTTPPDGLSPDESALVNFYRSADDRARRLIARLAGTYATHHPRYEAPDVEVRRLHLIVGGAS